MNKFGWKTLSSKIEYKSKWLSVVHNEVVTPDDKKAAYDIVERKDIVLIIPKLDNNTYYMVDQYRYAIDSQSLEFPQGFCEGGDTSSNAQRELEEEIGYRANQLTMLGRFWISAGFMRQSCTVYLAEYLVRTERKLEDTEVGMTSKMLTYQEITANIIAGKISNASSIAALSLLISRAE